jgi:hypothetical protein
MSSNWSVQLSPTIGSGLSPRLLESGEWSCAITGSGMFESLATQVHTMRHIVGACRVCTARSVMPSGGTLGCLSLRGSVPVA